MKILNLTTTSASQEEIAKGVFDLPAHLQTELREILTFTKQPDVEEATVVAKKLFDVVKKVQTPYTCLVVGGVPAVVLAAFNTESWNHRGINFYIKTLQTNRLPEANTGSCKE